MPRTTMSFTILTAMLLAACGERKDPTPAASTEPVAESGAAENASVTTSSSPATVEPLSYADAEGAFHHGQYAEAASKFESFTQQNPDNAWGQYMLGLSAWKSGQHERSLQAFDAALAIEPNHRKSLLNSARVLLETSQPQAALERVQKALSIEPLSSDGLRLMGRSYAELGHFDEAVDAYHRALAIDDTDVWAMNNLGFLYIQQGRSDAAIPPLARAVEIRGNVPVFQNNLGTALERSGHLLAAKAAYESALQADSTYEKASAGLARVTALAEGSDTNPVALPELSKQFQGEIEEWRAVPSDSTGAVPVSTDSVESDSAQPMVRDSASQ